MTSKITVIGSINMDLVTETKVVPKAGETVLGRSFFTSPGGKGANQAVAAAKLGADVTLIGCVGNDEFGKQLLANLKSQSVEVAHVQTIPNVSTGIASITLSEGDNRIIVVPGANEYVTPDLLNQCEDIIAKSDIVVLQLEIPLETVERAVFLSKKYHAKVILNPAPFQPLSVELLQNVDYIIPNEHEQKELLHLVGTSIDFKGKSIITRGSKGVSFYEDGKVVELPSLEVEVVDTTGAGDSFTGAIAVALCEGKTVSDACKFANVVGGLTVTKLGAQTGIPSREEVDHYLNSIE